MFLLYIFTGILAYAHKIPLLGRVISLITFWYGKTTWWRMLVKIRKIFIIVNAIIGILMVYKTVGFSSDNILAGFAGMGHTYIELFTNLTKRMFNWFVELFDHKVIPNVPKPGNNPSSYFWSPRGMDMAWHQKLPKLDSIPSEWVTNPFQVNINPSTPWYMEWKTWFYVAGTIGALYFGYKFIIDPLFIDGLNSASSSVTVKPNPIDPTDPNVGGDVAIGISDQVSKGIGNVTKSFVSGITTIRSKLNPLNWIMPTTDINAQLESFKALQNNMVTADRQFYPFTEVNPYDSWITRLRISWLGETISELNTRMREKAIALREIDLALNKSPVIDSPNSFVGGNLTPLPGLWTPKLGTLGLGNKYVSSAGGMGFLESIEASSSYQNTFDKFTSLPPTPKYIPTSLPDMDIEQISNVNPSWSNHAADPAEMDKYCKTISKLKMGEAWTPAKKTFASVVASNTPLNTNFKSMNLFNK